MIADVTTPDLRVLSSESPLIYTMGLRPATAQITLTTGLIANLDEEQLDAVLAHELSHVKHWDTMVMTAALIPAVVASGIYTLVTPSPPNEPPDGVFSPGASDSKYIGRGIGPIGTVVAPLAGLFWLFAQLLIAPLSRYRELAADRSAVAITGNSSSLATALLALSKQKPPDMDLRLVETTAMSIVPVFGSDSSRRSAWRTPLWLFPSWVGNQLRPLLAFHPPTTKRLEMLR
jgi:heat shock protein HtpX